MDTKNTGPGTLHGPGNACVVEGFYIWSNDRSRRPRADPTGPDETLIHARIRRIQWRSTMIAIARPRCVNAAPAGPPFQRVASTAPWIRQGGSSRLRFLGLRIGPVFPPGVGLPIGVDGGALTHPPLPKGFGVQGGLGGGGGLRITGGFGCGGGTSTPPPPLLYAAATVLLLPADRSRTTAGATAAARPYFMRKLRRASRPLNASVPSGTMESLVSCFNSSSIPLRRRRAKHLRPSACIY